MQISNPPRPEGLIAAAASAVVQHGYPRPVKHSVSQSDLGGIAHDDDAALATALGYGCHAREGPEGRVISTRERPGGLGEQGGERDRADPRQRTKDSRVARSAVLGSALEFWRPHGRPNAPALCAVRGPLPLRWAGRDPRQNPLD